MTHQDNTTLPLKTMFTRTKVTRNLAKAVAAVFAVMLCSCESDEDKIKVGQTWLVRVHEKNPYEEPIFFYRKVIAMQGDYVQYVENENDTLSDSKYWFLMNAVLVEDIDRQ